MEQEILELIVMQIPTIVGFVWWAGNQKAALYHHVGETKKNLGEALTSIDKRLDLHIQDSHAARDSLADKITGQGKRFGSKFDRMEGLLDKNINFERLEQKIDRLIGE